ncbi:MAG: class I SAM-dependent methyltransferase [Bacteroidales bacterium]
MKNNPFEQYTHEYEEWFKENEVAFRSELLALKQMIPPGKNGLEIGIGSGIFARELGIAQGIDPSGNMLQLARDRGLKVVKGTAEELPFADSSFDYAAFITSLCFIEHPLQALREAYRVVKSRGDLIVAIIDKESPLGKSLGKVKEESRFYKDARFYSVTEMVSLIENSHFEITGMVQTLIDINADTPEDPVEGSGKGGFVVIRAKKKSRFED